MAETRWPHLLASWITPEIALANWRERIARVEAEETAHFASLPYVRGVAVIGSVGRGAPWPLSDLDLLIVADPWNGEDPEWPIRREEAQRIKRLHAAGIPNDVEAGNWVLTADEVRAAVDGDGNTFFGILDHPHWIGAVMKAEGARVTYDFEGCVAPFVERCRKILWSDRFVNLWIAGAADDAEERLRKAAGHVAEGETAAASLEVILAAHVMTGGLYAAWRRLPESISRGVTRFLAAAEEMDEHGVASCFLSGARLTEDEAWERFARVPPAGQRERDVWLAIRQGSGEDIGCLEATRDLLHVSLWEVAKLDDQRSGPYAQWTGVTDDKRTVRGQFEAAQAMLERLQQARDEIERGLERD